MIKQSIKGLPTVKYNNKLIKMLQYFKVLDFLLKYLKKLEKFH